MKTTLVRYKTAPEHAEENAALIRAVFEELRSRAPGGIHYASFRMPDGVSFVHIAQHDDPNPLTSLPAFQAFTSGIKSRCVEQPVVTELSPVGSYAWLGEARS